MGFKAITSLNDRTTIMHWYIKHFNPKSWQYYKRGNISILRFFMLILNTKNFAKIECYVLVVTYSLLPFFPVNRCRGVGGCCVNRQTCIGMRVINTFSDSFLPAPGRISSSQRSSFCWKKHSMIFLTTPVASTCKPMGSKVILKVNNSSEKFLSDWSKLCFGK